MPLPENITQVWVRGTLIDGDGDPVRGRVVLQPSPAGLVDPGARRNIGLMRPYVGVLDADGAFAVKVPATDDPDVNPAGWSYDVSTPIHPTYPIVVPYLTPVLVDPEDDLDGERVLELSAAAPIPAPQSGTVQTLPPSAADVASAVEAYLAEQPITGGYLHTQTLSSTVWSINHGLMFAPAGFEIFDEVGDRHFPNTVSYPSEGVVQLTFLRSVRGTARVS